MPTDTLTPTRRTALVLYDGLCALIPSEPTDHATERNVIWAHLLDLIPEPQRAQAEQYARLMEATYVTELTRSYERGIGHGFRLGANCVSD